MTDLVATVRAARASASALASISLHNRRMRDAMTPMEFAVAKYKRDLAKVRYAKAQAVLAANPLPGDAS